MFNRKVNTEYISFGYMAAKEKWLDKIFWH